MVQSVELLVDRRLEERLVGEWRALAAAGLPSQARHTAPSNRPHVTVVAVDAIDPAREPEMAAAAEAVLPLEVQVGPITVFGRGPFVLVRSVIASVELLDLHAAVAAATQVPADSLSAVRRWVPHVTLARQMSPDQVAAALAVVPGDTLSGRAEELRRWDGTARREWLVQR